MTTMSLEDLHAYRSETISADADELIERYGRYPQTWHEETADELRARFDRMRAKRGGRRTRGEMNAF